MRKKDYDLNARFQQAADAIALGYIENEDVAELKKLVERESRLLADSNCPPAEYCAESLRPLLQETPAILDMSDKSGRNLLRIAEQTNNSTHESAVSVIREESDITRWRRSASEGSLVRAHRNMTEAASASCGHAEKIIKERRSVQSNPDLQTLADIESQGIRANLYHKLGVGKASTGSADISK